MTLKVHLNFFTERPEATPLTADTVRFNRTSEFANLDNEVGHIITATLDTIPQEIPA